MPHRIRRPGVLAGGSLAMFLALVHLVNDAVTAILGALLPTLQERFDVGPSTLALLVATYWFASSVTQPVLGSLAEDVGLRTVAAAGVLSAALFLSLIGVAPELWIVFLLLVVGGIGSAALHPVGTTVAAASRNGGRALGVGLFTAGGMVGFALGPLAILHLVDRYGAGATPWLMAPGVALAAAVALLLPEWEPHGRRPLRRLFDRRLVAGPVGALAVAGSLTSVAFVTFTSSVPLWLVQEHGYDAQAAMIGWTLGAFSLAAGGGAVLGGVLAPRIGRGPTIVGSLLLTPVPLVALVLLQPGTMEFFVAAGAGGLLLYTSSSVKVVIAQDLAPHAPVAASGMILGMTSALGGVLYVALGRLQELVGLAPGMAVAFLLAVPAAVVAAAVLLRHPEVTDTGPRPFGHVATRAT